MNTKKELNLKNKSLIEDLKSDDLNVILKALEEIGEKYGLDWAEQFHYIGPTHSAIDGYIEKNAIPKK